MDISQKDCENLSQYLAHEGQSLFEHMSECAKTVAVLLAQIGLPKLGRALGWLHDFGKLSDDYASYLADALKCPEQFDRGKRGSVDHSTSGAQFIWEQLQVEKEMQYSALSFLRQMMVLCVASHHHHSLIDCWRGDSVEDEILIQRLKKAYKDTHYTEIVGKLSNHEKRVFEELLNRDELEKEFKDIYHTIINGRDKKSCLFNFGMLARLMFSALISADYMSSSGRGFLLQNTVPDWALMQSKVEEYMKQFKADSELNQCRAEMSEACLKAAQGSQGIWSLTLPTGAGKTLASLRFALAHARKYKLSRIVYVIPYTTILDQTSASLEKVLGQDLFKQLVLVHHSNFVMEDKDADGSKEEWSTERKNWYMEICQTWDIPIVLTTSVQYLNACYAAGKQHVRRMNSLMRSVIIFDEVQAIPWSSKVLFEKSLEFWALAGGSTLLKCTATQPKSKEQKSVCGKGGNNLERGEIVPNCKVYFARFEQFRNVEVQCEVSCRRRKWTLEAMVDLIVEAAEKDCTVLTIVNTKSLAARLFKKCQECLPEALCYHLSTNMCPAHRLHIVNNHISKEALEKARQEKKPLICISTQLIEAGVDVDFDVVIRTVAGLDSCMQAAGRCNRDASRYKGRVIVLNPSDELEKIDQLWALNKAVQESTKAILTMDDCSRMLDMENVNNYFERYQQILDIEKSGYTSYITHVGKIVSNLVDLYSCNSNLFKKSDRYEKFSLFQAFDLAASNYKPIDDDTIAIFSPYEEGETLIGELSDDDPFTTGDWDSWKDKLSKLRPYSVSIRENKVSEYLREGTIYAISEKMKLYAIPKGKYSETLGILPNGVELLTV